MGVGTGMSVPQACVDRMRAWCGSVCVEFCMYERVLIMRACCGNFCM